MTKEKLLEWGLTEEQATKVMEGLNGSFVTKARFNEVNTELTTAKNTIKERDTQLESVMMICVIEFIQFIPAKVILAGVYAFNALDQFFHVKPP